MNTELDCRENHALYDSLSLCTDNGMCLGWRAGAGQPYQWLTYQEVCCRCASSVESLFHSRLRRLLLSLELVWSRLE